MNIEEMKSPLKMSSLYFPECVVRRKEAIDNGKLKVDLQRDIQEIGAHTYSVNLILTVGENESDLSDLYVRVVATAVFEYEAEGDYNSEQNIINKNAVAIIFPFVRSQVTLMTSQPGMNPIVLPPLNVSKFK